MHSSLQFKIFYMKTKWAYLYAAYLKLNTKALIAVCVCTYKLSVLGFLNTAVLITDIPVTLELPIPLTK